MLKERGYRTGMVGKWHLGRSPARLPCPNGFDEFYGLPYSNDMYPLPIMGRHRCRRTSGGAAPINRKIHPPRGRVYPTARRQPFFLYFADTAPHIQLAPSPKFKGKSAHGQYGDVVMELDWSVGQVLDALKDKGIDENTLVIFTSDNGPWYQGSAGRLQGRKGSPALKGASVSRSSRAIPA